MKDCSTIVIGAGPAGLAAAYRLVKLGLQPILLEKTDKVGGLARTESYKGHRFDIGGHRFFTKVEEVQQLWQELLGERFLKVRRLSRIYYRGHFFDYPLNFFDALSHLGVFESLLILVSYLRARLQPHPEEKTFEQWVTNRFGHRLYETFFKAYTEKVWGIPCSEIQADWAAQRIRGLSLMTAASNALFGTDHAKTLINEFQYPAWGPGMMWQRLRDAVESQGGQVHFNAEVVRIGRKEDHVESVSFRCGDKTVALPGEHVISSMPIDELIAQIDPPPPAAVLQAARRLSYRAFVIVGLIVNQADLFPDNWIYVHSPEVRVGRIQNFKNWSAAMVADPAKTSLGLEYFCTEGDDIWTMSDSELILLASRELTGLGLGDISHVVDGVVFRQPKAYPVYDGRYRENLDVIQHFLATLDNLQTIGRNGMHRYNNMDHSMLTGMLAAENVLGGNHDLWKLNEEPQYLEEKVAGTPTRSDETEISTQARIP